MQKQAFALNTPGTDCARAAEMTGWVGKFRRVERRRP